MYRKLAITVITLLKLYLSNLPDDFSLYISTCEPQVKTFEEGYEKVFKIPFSTLNHQRFVLNAGMNKRKTDPSTSNSGSNAKLNKLIQSVLKEQKKKRSMLQEQKSDDLKTSGATGNGNYDEEEDDDDDDGTKKPKGTDVNIEQLSKGHYLKHGHFLFSLHFFQFCHCFIADPRFAYRCKQAMCQFKGSFANHISFTASFYIHVRKPTCAIKYMP
jgi:hypothetical protein